MHAYIQGEKTDIFGIQISCISSFNRTDDAWISHDRYEACQINRRYQFFAGVSSHSNCKENLLMHADVGTIIIK
jgi:hypothetical protein